MRISSNFGEGLVQTIHHLSLCCCDCHHFFGIIWLRACPLPADLHTSLLSMIAHTALQLDLDVMSNVECSAAGKAIANPFSFHGHSCTTSSQPGWIRTIVWQKPVMGYNLLHKNISARFGPTVLQAVPNSGPCGKHSTKRRCLLSIHSHCLVFRERLPLKSLQATEATLWRQETDFSSSIYLDGQCLVQEGIEHLHTQDLFY